MGKEKGSRRGWDEDMRVSRSFSSVVESPKKNDPELISRTRDKTVQKKDEPHSFSGVKRQVLLQAPLQALTGSRESLWKAQLADHLGAH